MSERLSVSLPQCNRCHRPIVPSENGLNFPCPNCGKVVIWRCAKCRALARAYVCPSCGFEGP